MAISKVKTVNINELEAMMLNTPEALQAFEDADRELALSEQLYRILEESKLKQNEVAEVMGVKPSSVSRLVRTPGNATLKTLERFATACGTSLSLNFQHK